MRTKLSILFWIIQNRPQIFAYTSSNKLELGFYGIL